MQKTLRVSLTATFAALHVVLYLLSFGLWRNWGIYLAPLEGIILGPETGFLSALIGSVAARMIKPDAFWMFGVVAEPISVLMTGLLARGKWKPVLAAYVVMLVAYFIHPLGQTLPVWTILDILLAALVLYPAAKISKKLYEQDATKLTIALVLISFVCVATDAIVRIFMLVPCGLHSIFFTSSDAFYAVFVAAAVDSYVEDILVVIVTLLVSVPLVVTISKSGFLKKMRKSESL